jgi:hypothetical protein
VSIAELQELYGFSERWWRSRVSEGMPVRRWGGRLRFSPSEVEDSLDKRYPAS